jgi:hypothetical protein
MTLLRAHLRPMTAAEVAALPPKEYSEAWRAGLSRRRGGYLVLCGRAAGRCGGRLGYIKVAGTPPKAVASWFPPSTFVRRPSGLWEPSHRAAIAYRRRQRETGDGYPPTDDHPQSVPLGRRRRPRALIPAAEPGFLVERDRPHVHDGSIPALGLYFAPLGPAEYSARCPNCGFINSIVSIALDAKGAL